MTDTHDDDTATPDTPATVQAMWVGPARHMPGHGLLVWGVPVTVPAPQATGPHYLTDPADMLVAVQQATKQQLAAALAAAGIADAATMKKDELAERLIGEHDAH